MHEGPTVAQYRALLPGYSIQHPSNKPRHALLRIKDERLLSGSGGDIEVIHPLELERSQNTGLPVRVTHIGLFGGLDTVQGIIQPTNSDHVFVYGQRHAILIHSNELFEGTVVAKERILELPSVIVAVNVEKLGKTELLLTFLLETGVYHYSLSLDEGSHYACLLCFKCTRPIQSGLLWRDSGLLHIAYYDGYIRIGIVNEDYDDMLLVKRLSSCRNNLSSLMETLCVEVERLTNFEENQREKRIEMFERIKALQSKMPSPTKTPDSNGSTASDEDSNDAHVEFVELKMAFKNQSIRTDRISHRLVSLRKLMALLFKATNYSEHLDKTIQGLEEELSELANVSRIYDECVATGNEALINKSRGVLEEKKWRVEELMMKTNMDDVSNLIGDWDKKISEIIESLTGKLDPPKDMRTILCHSIYEFRTDRTDRFTHFLLDHSARDLTLYCMSGLSTLAVYPRKGIRVASISLDPSYETTLTSACLMTPLEGVYVADDKGVFPIYFNRDKRYFDAGNPISLPPFDNITSILMEDSGLVLGSITGGLLHLAFDTNRKFDHVIIASSMLSHHFSHGVINDLKILAAGETHLAIHASNSEVTISEKDVDRWHRITGHTGGAHCLAVTPFSLENRGAFVVVGSTTYVRIKALQYTEDNMVGLHDLGESRVTEDGTAIEVLHVSLDPSMEFRPIPCKLRYAIAYADKAIRTYVAILSGEHEFEVSEKFIAQIEPLHHVNTMICFHGRPMGCYVSNSKKLQIWNDLDRHQQKKMKSERMELMKMGDISIVTMERVEGRSCYLLIAYKDNSIEVYEERGKGTGKIEKCGAIPAISTEGVTLTVTRTRISSTSRGDRLFLHTILGNKLFIHTILIEAGKLTQSEPVLNTVLSLNTASSLELLPYKPYEFILFGKGIHNHRLTEEERKALDKFRDFEF
ncbi:unnamed protein product [Auanema sp. JU1783]|nr:unnamed protein product [Auanema sp. JU1783]